MKRVLAIKLFLMLCLAALLNLQIARNLGADPIEHIWEQLFSGRIAADILVIGASHAANGINPRYLEAQGTTTWNFGLGGISPGATMRWYRRVYRKFAPKPKLVIYEANWFVFDPDWLKREYEQYSKNFPLRFFLAEMLDGDNDREALLMNRMPIFYDFDLRYLFSRKHYASSIATTYHGYSPKKEPSYKLDVQRLVTSREDVRREQIVDQLLECLRADGVQVVMVQAPEFLPGRTCARVAANNASLQRLAEKHRIPFFNYNDERSGRLNYEKAYYYDWGHLNSKGADAFSARLKKDLEGAGILQSTAPLGRESALVNN